MTAYMLKKVHLSVLVVGIIFLTGSILPRNHRARRALRGAFASYIGLRRGTSDIYLSVFLTLCSVLSTAMPAPTETEC